VVAFAALKQNWTVERDKWNESHTNNILASFAKTGVWPFNASVVTPEQMAPSTAHSTTVMDESQNIHMYERSNTELTIDPDLLPPNPSTSSTVVPSTPTAPVTPTRLQTLPPTFERARTKAMEAMEATLAFSSSSSFIVSSSPLHSTFKLPEHVYGHVGDLPNINWQLADSPPKRSAAHRSRKDMEDEINNLRNALRGSKAHKEAAVRAIDATNAQLARVKNTFGRLVTHSEFHAMAAEAHKRHKKQEQATSTRRKLTDAWKSFKSTQDTEIASWKVEKDRCKAAGLKAPPKPRIMLKKDWVIQNNPGSATQASGSGLESEGSEGGDDSSDDEH